ncbi:MAG: hypothetical protein IH867_00810 [Chloroflexi bacterium]|nr:hypothetical protein [Chloroflexota bacterium]
MPITDGQRVIVNSNASHLDEFRGEVGIAERVGACDCKVRAIGGGQDHFDVTGDDGTLWVGTFHENELASAPPE